LVYNGGRLREIGMLEWLCCEGPAHPSWEDSEVMPYFAVAKGAPVSYRALVTLLSGNCRIRKCSDDSWLLGWHVCGMVLFSTLTSQFYLSFQEEIFGYRCFLSCK